ncbi:acyltransferase family protein [Bacteroides sp. BFG-257]|uniref:acyltransferase family protein n=1 Tax=Bacteroides TaxID=816 RepID=UPI001CCA8963|nr:MULTISPECIES: acyltransferase family protein [Bacteroides]UBD69669.1 acyltransferase family protein [Bacteroides cellulosilyticus]UVO98315.1 acyltransferase family protein [Bacteroides sp. BFG-257]
MNILITGANWHTRPRFRKGIRHFGHPNPLLDGISETTYQQSEKAAVAQNMETKRDLYLDIAKGICIILMVLGHSGCPEWMNRFMVLFRMPCFFFISGILLSDRYLTDVKGGICKKLKGYYQPYVKWTLIFLLLHNTFTYLHIYETSYTWQETAIKIVRTIIMTGGEQLLGGYWFLISLTWASIGTIVILSALRNKNKLTNVHIWEGVILAVLIASTEHLLPFKLPAQFGPQTFLALAFFMSGYIYRKSGLNKSKHLSQLYVLLLLIPAIVSVFADLSMSTAEALSGGYFVVALSGIIGFIQLAKKLEHDKVVALFNYIGNKTLYILTFYFLAFKPISYILIRLNGLPISDLSQFPVLKETSSWMWTIYTVAGICLPLLVWELFHLPFLRFKKIKNKSNYYESLSLLIWELKNKVVKCLMNLTHTNHFRKV